MPAILGERGNNVMGTRCRVEIIAEEDSRESPVDGDVFMSEVYRAHLQCKADVEERQGVGNAIPDSFDASN